MKRLFSRCSCLLLLLLAAFPCCNNMQTKTGPMSDKEAYPLNISDMHIRDPFIMADSEDNTYYMHANGGKNSIVCYASKDLRHWKLCGESFIPPEDFWGKQDFWAPKLYRHEGKYYMFVSFFSEEHKRGISVLVSERPDEGFRPLTNRPLTPDGWYCLDGTLFIDRDGQPWLVFAREWLEVRNGEVYVQRLSKDFTRAVGDPIFLFKGSDADWPGLITTGARTGIVTNAPFIQMTESGELLMIWSSFCTDGAYAIGTAVSRSGQVQGPWTQKPGALNDDGGHAMLFQDFNGTLLISYHTNEPPVHVIMRPVSIQQENLLFLN